MLYSLEQAAGSIGLHVNADKTEYMCFNQKGYIFTLNGGSLKLAYVRSLTSEAASHLLKMIPICD